MHKQGQKANLFGRSPTYSYLCGMVTKIEHDSAKETEIIKSKYRVDYVDSGLPRWLIEAAFICIVVKAVFNWSPVIDLTDGDFFYFRAIVNTIVTLVMYVGLLRG